MATNRERRRRRPRAVLSEHYQVIVAVALIVLLAGSLLYCLGFASLAARHALEALPPAGNGSLPGADELNGAPVLTDTEIISSTGDAHQADATPGVTVTVTISPALP